jgi:hypothetical protein
MTAFVPFQGPDRLPETSVNLQVVLLYENVRSGFRAKQAFDHLLDELELDTTFRFEPIGFDLLRDGSVGQALVKGAMGADIVVIAADEAGLPSHVEAWLAAWVSGRTHATAAVVVSMDESWCDDSVTANFLHHMMDLAIQPGVSLFHHFAPTPTAEGASSVRDAWQRPRRSAIGPNGTLCRSESPRFRV